MKVTQTTLPGVCVIEPRAHGDDRGFFLETFAHERYRNEAGITHEFVQDNHSRSRRGVLRGLHSQAVRPQGKLVRVSRGEVFDVAADINPRSATFGKWFAAILSDQNHLQLWIPPGYAHGFLVLSEQADFEYKCTNYYDPSSEIGAIWNDPDLAIDWPLDNPQISAKDARLPGLRQILAQA
jgi:dTDP-4-dehydrorhamnose 3,5-epimerase